MTKHKTWQLLGGVSGFMGVAMGAVAAHAMGNPVLAAYADRGAIYQLFHSLLLLWLAGHSGRGYTLARWCVLLGIMVFSGSFYVRALTAIPETMMFAPYGGSLLLAGWLATAFAGRKYF
jgi:uncharacterized membrane protein YgdD (TMEM256/DUF423 family)